MSLNYCFKKATHSMHRLPPDSREVLDALCRQIQAAERNLNAAAALRLQAAWRIARALLPQLASGSGFRDSGFVYILTLEPKMAAGMASAFGARSLFSLRTVIF